MTDLNPCWKCGSPGMIDENGGYQYAVCTNTRGCSNSGNWGMDVADWNRGGLTEVQELRQQLRQAKEESERVRKANLHTMDVFEDMKAAKEQAERRIAELEQVATSVRRDLILRAEPDWDGSGQQVVNLSAGIWDELNRVLDIKGNRRKAQAQTCSYPECNCPFDMGPDHQFLRGRPVIRK